MYFAPPSKQPPRCGLISTISTCTCTCFCHITPTMHDALQGYVGILTSTFPREEVSQTKRRKRKKEKGLRTRSARFEYNFGRPVLFSKRWLKRWMKNGDVVSWFCLLNPGKLGSRNGRSGGGLTQTDDTLLSALASGPLVGGLGTYHL